MKSVFVTTLLLSLQLFAQEVPPFATITSIDYRGSGCDAESARAAITSDLSYISVLYDRFSVSIGQGSENPLAPQAMKNCAVVIKMDLPAGWSFQFEAVEYQGFVSLPNQSYQAIQRISAFTRDGLRGRDFDQHVMTGPKTENFSYVYRNPILNIIQPENMMTRFNNPNLGGRFGPIMRDPPQRPGGPGGGGPGGGLGRRLRQRKGDLFDCSERTQQAVLVLRSAIALRKVQPRKSENLLASLSIDSTDSVVQKLKLNWNKCLVD